MRFLGRKWQLKNNSKNNDNRISRFRPTGYGRGGVVAASRLVLDAGLKSHTDFAPLAARLKSRPFKVTTFFSSL